ncbi:hypothetical protein MAR_030760, partial [Mya arenaria]
LIKPSKRHGSKRVPEVDNISYNVFRNDIETGKTPSDWGKGVLSPILKPAEKHAIQAAYKNVNIRLYVKVNGILSEWFNINQVLRRE